MALSEYQCIKYTLVVFNILDVLLGIGVLVIGILIAKGDNVTSDLSESDIMAISRYMIGLGVTNIIIGLFGCAGAFFENKTLLGFYFAAMLIVTIYCLAIVIITFILKDKLEANIETQFDKELMEKYGTDNGVTKRWDAIQRKNECCGVKGDVNSNTSWAFYRKTSWYKKQTGAKCFVPESCCKKDSDIAKCRDTQSLIPVQGTPVTKATAANDLLFKDGCLEKLMPNIRAKLRQSNAVTMTTLFVSMFAAIFSCALCLAIRREQA